MKIVVYKRYGEKEVIDKERFLKKYISILPLSHVRGCKLLDNKGKLHWVVNDYEDLRKQIMKK